MSGNYAHASFTRCSFPSTECLGTKISIVGTIYCMGCAVNVCACVSQAWWWTQLLYFQKLMSYQRPLFKFLFLPTPLGSHTWQFGYQDEVRWGGPQTDLSCEFIMHWVYQAHTVNLRCFSNNWISALSALGWMLKWCKLFKTLDRIPQDWVVTVAKHEPAWD